MNIRTASNSKHFFKMKNIILNGLFIVLICSMSMRLIKASSDDENYEGEDEYMYDEYDYNNSDAPRIQDYEGTSETSVVVETKINEIVKNVADHEHPSIKSSERHEDRTESLYTVLVADTEILQHDDCPKLCTCDEPLQFIDCSNQSLSGIPKNLPNTTLQINLADNEIREIQESDLSNLTVVRKIMLNNNNIQNINGSVFQALHRLDSLDLSSNNISKIDPDLFVHAQGLSELLLSYNPIAFEADRTFLNLPELQILDLVGCNITVLYNETFTNLSGLKSLNLANNSFVEDINVDAFNPLSFLLKLKIPHVSKTATYGLCDKITVIDVISFDSYNISCYELISGATYDESTITHGPTLDLESTTMPMRSASTTQAPIVEVTEAATKSTTVIPENSSTSPKINANTKIDALNTTKGEDEDPKTQQVQISPQLLKMILIVSIAIAVFGLVIGLICRKDVLGVKTKLCRTQRPEQQTIPEQVPLNKV